MGKTLVVYFSVSPKRVTEKLAKELSEEIGADLLEVEPLVPYTQKDLQGIRYFSRRYKEQKKYREVPIKDIHIDVEDYSTFFIGFPSWFEKVPMVIQAFYRKYIFNRKSRCYFFITIGGSSNIVAPRESDDIGSIITDDIHELVSWAQKLDGAYRYRKNRLIHIIPHIKEDEYPKDMPGNAQMPFESAKETAFFCNEKDNVEYIMTTEFIGKSCTISAYIIQENKRVRIGGAFYYHCSRGIYLDRFVVAENYRRVGVGANMIRSIAMCEMDLLLSGQIMAVHPSSSGVIHGDELSQEELCSYYEKFGFLLVNSGDDFEYKNTQPREEIRENLKSLIIDVRTECENRILK